MTTVVQLQSEGDPFWKLPNDRTYLIVPDLHQDLGWLNRVLEKEEGLFDHIILLGDYFDAYCPSLRTNRKRVANRLDELFELYPERVTVLLGNHDLPYLVTAMTGRPLHAFADIKGYDAHISQHMPAILKERVWPSGQLFAYAHGYLISHAGVAQEFWPDADTVEESLDYLWGYCRQAMEQALGMKGGVVDPFSIVRHPLLEPGRVRGGEKQERGGITWQDWNLEFSDEDIPLPQIVGHTKSAQGARQNGRSWCLDGAQSCYGLLDANELEVRSV